MVVMLPKDSFPSLLAENFSLVKCTFLPSLEKCFFRGLENGYFLRHNQEDFYKEGETVRYVCHSDYQAQHEEVTCTRNGWAPPPRCTRKSECAGILLRVLSEPFIHFQKFLPQDCLSQNDLAIKNLTYYKSFLSEYKTETSNQDFHPFKWNVMY